MDASGKIVAVASKRVVVTYFTTKETDSFLLDDQLRVSADILLERFNIEDNEVLYAYEGGNIGVRRGNVVPDEGFFDFSPYFKTEISSINVILCGDEKELNSGEN